METLTQTPPIEQQPRSFQIFSIQPGTEEFDEWLKLRQEYVGSQNWETKGPGDEDEYDNNPETLHLVAQDPKTGALVAGLRLTPIKSIEESLSWGMLSPAMQNAARGVTGDNLAQLATDNMWDLTRLVATTGTAVDPKVKLDAILTLLYEGLAQTRNGRVSPRWVFATDMPFISILKRWNITVHKITTGIIPNANTGDLEPETVFCYADPANQKNAAEAHHGRNGDSWPVVSAA